MDRKLERAKEFLSYFGVPTDGDFIPLNDSGNSVICNPNTEWKEFLGYSVNSISIFVAKELNKETKWI